MPPKYILIAGSADPDCPPEKLDRAHKFVAAVTEEIIKTGNGLVVLAAGEPTRGESDDAVPLIFDWAVLRTIARILDDSYGNADRILARVVTGADSDTKRFSPANTGLIQQLEAKNAVEVQYIDENLYYGGSYRETQTDLSDAMIAIGGGIGTYDIGNRMLQAGKPVMPMHISIGSRDGDGALRLLSEMKTDPPAFLPRSHQEVNRHLLALSLEHISCWSIQRIAYQVANILAAELEVSSNDSDNPPGGFRKFLNKMMRKTPAAIQTASHTTRTAESIARLFE